MTTNPYAPPAADLAPPPNNAQVHGRVAFYAVPVSKLAIMTVCTFGLYLLNWFYQNFRILKERDEDNSWPVIRAIFSAFTSFLVFREISDQGERLGMDAAPASRWAIIYFVLCVVANLPGLYSLGWFAVVWLMGEAQAYVNRINESVAPDHDRNARYTAWNWVGIVVGAPLLILGVIGMAME
jgi:hypothetical protein